MEVPYWDFYTFMFTLCCHWGSICFGNFWFPFHGVKALWHFQYESTVCLHWSPCFIRGTLRKFTHRLTFTILSTTNKLENSSVPLVWKVQSIILENPLEKELAIKSLYNKEHHKNFPFRKYKWRQLKTFNKGGWTHSWMPGWTHSWVFSTI